MPKDVTTLLDKIYKLIGSANYEKGHLLWIFANGGETSIEITNPFTSNNALILSNQQYHVEVTVALTITNLIDALKQIRLRIGNLPIIDSETGHALQIHLHLHRCK